MYPFGLPRRKMLSGHPIHTPTPLEPLPQDKELSSPEFRSWCRSTKGFRRRFPVHASDTELLPPRPIAQRKAKLHRSLSRRRRSKGGTRKGYFRLASTPLVQIFTSGQK